MVCAGSRGHATCNGDSGGPLVCPDANGVGKLTGIVSFGYTGCTDAGVYAKVRQIVLTAVSVTDCVPGVAVRGVDRGEVDGLGPDNLTK